MPLRLHGPVPLAMPIFCFFPACGRELATAGEPAEIFLVMWPPGQLTPSPAVGHENDVDSDSLISWSADNGAIGLIVVAYIHFESRCGTKFAL